jgi:hypothetical protein
MRWVKDDNPNSAINNKSGLTSNGKSAAQNRWIAYNKMRGQYASAMEHATPEQFWVDKSSCSYVDENGQTKNPTLEPCAEAISAVKAIAIARNEGQKIYTITPQNAATALPMLPVGGDVGSEIRSAVQSGKEVTVHERAINANGWTGYGYIIIDPDTGAGSYLIEGKGNGAIMILLLGIVFMLAAVLIIEFNPILGFALLFIGMLFIGCAFTMLTKDARFVDAAAALAGGAIAAISYLAAVSPIGAILVPLLLGLAAVITKFSAWCVNPGG